MDNKNLFKKCRSRLMLEGILKSLICGLIIGFSASFIISIVTWVIAYNGLWIALGVGLGLTLLCGLFFYFTKFRPTTKKIAERMDRLGLEERMITMLELENNDSFMAKRQREDAKAKLQNVNSKQIHFSFAKAIIISIAICGVLGTSMTTVMTLSAYGIIPSFLDITHSIFAPETEDDLMVTYIVRAGGFIDGKTDQFVKKGENASQVTAYEDDGWMFLGWSDGSSNPVRNDVNVQKEIAVTAIFIMLEDANIGKDPSDTPNDYPGGEGGDGSTSDNPNTDSPPNNDGGSSGKGQNNNLIDGKTDYREILNNPQYYEAAMKALMEGGNLTPEMKAFIETYFGILKT